MLLFSLLRPAVGLHLVRGNVYVALLGSSSRGWLCAQHLIEVIIHIVVVVMAHSVAIVHIIHSLRLKKTGVRTCERHLNFCPKF